MLVRTDGQNWLLHRMKDQRRGRSGRAADVPEPPARGSRRAGIAGADDGADGHGHGRGRRRLRRWPTRPRSEPDRPTRPPDPPTCSRCWPPRAPSADVVGDDWRFEGKWDGIRALAAVGGGGLRLTSRTGRDITAGYPELIELIELTAGHCVVLDGEIVALDADGRTDFGRLQQRMGLSKPGDVRRVAPEGAGPVLRLRHAVARRDLVAGQSV